MCLLLLKSNITQADLARLRRAVQNLPALRGAPISLEIRPELTTCRERLLSGEPERGTAVHAAAFIRKRQIVIETALLRSPAKLCLILVHEIFHFVWARLGNRLRGEFAAILQNELSHNARGELGESALLKKTVMLKASHLWGEYACESFCDTAAWYFAHVSRSREFALATRWQNIRKHWFLSIFREVRKF